MAAGAKSTERPLTALDVIYGRRSVRSYARKPLEASTIRALLDAAVQAPTAVHKQPWLFVVVEDQWVIGCISDRAKALFTEEGWKGSHSAVPASASVHAQFLRRLNDPSFNLFCDAPVLVVICGRDSTPFVAADCWLAAENLMLAATALGLGSCCIGAAIDALNTPEVKTLLRIPVDVHAIAPIVVGIPVGTVAPVPRREPEIISWR
ncbi:MAG: nitroreductase family protein [Vicinamibacterales bacterium]